MAKTKIPSDVMDEIRFMFGSIECCEEFLKPILERHGYTGEGFLTIEPEDDMELTMDVYDTLFGGENHA